MVSEAVLKNDLIHGSLIGEMLMKIEEEKHVGDTSFDAAATREVERSEASVPGISRLDGRERNSGQAHKFMGDISESDAECQEDDDEDEPQEEMNKAVQWTEDDQRNLIDLGSSEIERNKRLESLIAKRRARKLLSMQPRRNLMDFNDNERQVTSIVTARSVDDADGQPGSAPSVLLPARNPFDLPYDPHEEKPVLTGGSFEEEFFNQLKDISFCRHESFILGSGFMEELSEDPVTRSFTGFLTKPRIANGPRFCRFRRPSDMEQHTELFSEELSRAAQLNQDQNHSSGHMKIMPPEEKKSGNLSEQEFHQNDKAAFLTGSADYNAEMLVNKEENLPRTDDEEDAETKDNESINDMEMTVATADEAELKPDVIGEKVDELSSPSSSEASEDTHFVNADKNEAFRNSVKKVLTCLILKNKGSGTGKIGLSIEPLYDSSPTARRPSKMEERSFYTGRPFHTPNLSVASDMLVEVSEVGSPSFNAEANTPTDRGSLVYDADVDKDVNSGDEDLWGASPRPITLEEYGPSCRVHETGEMVNLSLGLSICSSHDPIESSGQPEKLVNPAMEDSSILSSPMSMLLKDSRPELSDFGHRIDDHGQQVLTNGQDSRSSVSTSSEQEQLIDNSVILPATHDGSSTADCSVLVDNSQVQQRGTQGEDVEARQSSGNSVSPVRQQESLIEQALVDLSSSTRSVLQETLIMDEVDPTSSGQIMHNENHHLLTNSLQQSSILVVNSQCQPGGTGGNLEARQSSHNSVSPFMLLESVVEQAPVDFSSSPKSALQESVRMEEVASTSSEQNTQTDTQQSDRVVVRNDSQNSLQGRSHVILNEERHSENLMKQASPAGKAQAAKQEPTSLQNAATEANVSMREPRIHDAEAKEHNSIQDGINGSSSSSGKQTADILQILAEETDPILDTASEAEVQLRFFAPKERSLKEYCKGLCDVVMTIKNQFLLHGA
ncbi:hypothetical protein Ancab_011519 [Ancistrocladus abbreviatus]